MQFGPGAMQQHGFARNLDWTVASSSADPNPDEKDPSVEFVLTENEYTLKMWVSCKKDMRERKMVMAGVLLVIMSPLPQ